MFVKLISSFLTFIIIGLVSLSSYTYADKFDGVWLLIEEEGDEGLEFTKERCEEEVSQGMLFNGVEIISNNRRDSFISMNDYSSCEILKIQKLRNTNTEIIDLSCSYEGDESKSRELWILREHKKILTTILSSEENTYIYNSLFCRKPFN